MFRRNNLGVGQVLPPPLPGATPEDKLDYIANQLARLMEISPVHLSPEAIIDFMQVGTPKGQIQVMGFAVPIAAAAGVTTTWQFRLPTGWVSVARTPYHFTSDFYDLNLTVEVLVEEEMRPITWGPLPMTGPRDILFDFFPKRYGMDVIVTNGTAEDVLVTGEATVVWLEKSYYDDVYLPLMQALYKAAKEVAR